MISLAVYTLGCKLNQLESESIACAFKAAGFRVVPWGGEADLLVINTCTVTSRAEQKARRVIRKALRDNPSSCIIVTGCYAQLEAEALAALETETRHAPGGLRRRLCVVPGAIKSRLLDLPGHIAGTETGSPASDLPALLAGWKKFPGLIGSVGPIRSDGPGGEGEGVFRFNAEDFSFHSRAFLKVQDGCDHGCSYCRVSLARGKSVSLDRETVLTRLRALEERGLGEVVLTGVNLNQYRMPEAPCPGGQADLWGLL
ncbi:MAG: tRNA (N(6)-L-threonylcarbamoyladenosine(37)-C(2))-methylthiotransferase MtaB, partial [Treponema sp.]|nr:tRNA (N(6)-L-threonylcarbamoyladenosine(37)-C(2))-methylthiotransferase MtaB [Treponema sp.]